MRPNLQLSRKINPEGAKSAGPLLHGWARRTARSMASTPRQIRALANYLPTAPAHVFTALGGDEALDWAKTQVAMIGLDDVAESNQTGEITVLGLPYGGPNGGRDNEGQYFSPMTDFMDGVIDNPPVMYIHGTQNGFEPEPIGKVKKRWYDRRGGWFKVQLDPQSPRYAQLLEAHETGNLYASTGAVPASYSASPSGHIDTWLVGELSLVDLREGYKPVNAYAITKAQVAFTDYYGDDVDWIGMDSIKELFNQLVSAIGKHVKEHQVIDEGIDRLEDLEDEMWEYMDSGDGYSMVKASGTADVDFGGKKRSKLKKSDFIFPDEEAFPVVTCDDAKDAINSWGRYKGSHSFEEFKSRLTAKMNKLNCPLPDKWEKAEEEIMTEKCEPCEEAARLAEELKADLNKPVEKCTKCPEAIRWIRAMVKAGKMAATEAFDHIEVFTISDETFDAVKAEVESRLVVPAKAEKVSIAGGQGQPDAQETVDETWIAKQRRLAGYTVGSK